jgi:hypothetical protein
MSDTDKDKKDRDKRPDLRDKQPKASKTFDGSGTQKRG